MRLVGGATKGIYIANLFGNAFALALGAQHSMVRCKTEPVDFIRLRNPSDQISDDI